MSDIKYKYISHRKFKPRFTEFNPFNWTHFFLVTSYKLFYSSFKLLSYFQLETQIKINDQMSMLSGE